MMSFHIYTPILPSLQPYLHESRHLHALNRVRGSGGRFLSVKKNQPSDRTNPPTTLCQQKSTPDSNTYSPETGDHGTMTATCSEITSISNGSVMFGWSDSQFSAASSNASGRMEQYRGRYVHGGNGT